MGSNKILSEEQATTKDCLVGCTRLEKYNGSKNLHRYQCPKCSQEFLSKPERIWSKHTQSCGCYHKHAISKFAWKGHGELSSQHFSQIKYHAQKRRLVFEITIEDAWRQFVKQDRLCAFTGLIITFPERLSKNTNHTASLDRVDNTKGYTIDNIQWVHKDVNQMKSNYSQERFLQICRMVTERNNNG